MKVLIIIPAYNESKNIASVIDGLKVYAPQADYVVINDCSTDRTADVCKEHMISFISLPINLGIGGAVQTGYLYAKEHDYDIAVQMDGDGQHDPSFLQALLAPLEEGKADIVIGSRFLTKEGFQSSKVRRLGIKLLGSLIYLCTGIQVNDVTSGFRAVNRKFISIYSYEYAQDYPEPEAIVAASMYDGRIREIPVVMQERTYGSSSITFWKSAYYMLKVSLAIVIYRITFHRRRRSA